MSAREPWPRRFYRADGGAPRITWIFFGDWRSGDRRFAVDGLPPIPAGVDRLDLEPADARWPSFALRDGLGERLAHDLPDLAEDVRAQRQARVLIGSIESPATLDWLRDLLLGALAIFEGGAVAMLDANGFRWWSEDALRQVLTEREPRHLVRWIASAEGRGIWLRTAGLATFGRPDVSVRDLHPDDRASAEEVVGRLISLSVDGALVPDGEELSWDGRTWRLRVFRDGPDAAAFAGNSWVELRRVQP